MLHKKIYISLIISQLGLSRNQEVELQKTRIFLLQENILNNNNNSVYIKIQNRKHILGYKNSKDGILTTIHCSLFTSSSFFLFFFNLNLDRRLMNCIEQDTRKKPITVSVAATQIRIVKNTTHGSYNHIKSPLFVVCVSIFHRAIP